MTFSYSFNKKRRYDIRPGTDDVGRDYELQVIGYLALKCLTERAKQFWLALNADGLEAFDDIILYKEDETAKRTLFLMQLKHRKDPWKNPFVITKKDFNLRKYESSFREIESMLKTEVPDFKYQNTKLLLQSTGVQCSDIQYIFFTNNVLKQTHHLRKVKKSNSSAFRFIEINSGSVFHIDHDKMKCNCRGECLRDFHSRFYLVPEQKSAHEMRQALAEQLAHLFTESEEKFRLDVADEFMIFLKEHCNGKVSNSEIREVLSKDLVKNSVAKIVLSYFLHKANTSDNSELSLSDLNYRAWVNITKRFQVVIVPNTSAFLKDIISRNQDRLVISPCFNCSNTVVTALKLSLNLKILLVCCPDKLGMFEMVFQTENASAFSRFGHIPKNSMLLLDECAVFLQGRATKFKHFYSKHKIAEIEDFASDTILDVLGNNLKIGENFNPLPTFHVLRSIPRITLSTDVFNLPQCIFIIIDSDSVFYKFLDAFNNKDLSSVVRRVKYEQDVVHAMSHVDFLAQSVHVLKLHLVNSQFVLEWIHSKTENVEDIVKCVVKSKQGVPLKSSSDALPLFTLKFKSKILVLANAGMGKSVFLSYLWSIYPTEYWVIYVSLNAMDFLKVVDFATFLEEYKSGMDAFSLYVFESMFISKSVTVLIDGYDEIAPTYVTESSKIIAGIIKEGLRVVVSSRNVMKTTLVELLNVPAYTLEPFNSNDQKMFLCQYYCNALLRSGVQADCEAVKQFASKLMARINISVWDRSFSEIPLQCHMLAEAFYDRCVTFCENGSFELPSNFSLLHLYELFVQKKMEIYWQEKVKIDSTTAAYKKLLEARTKEIEHNHMVAALQVVFPTSVVETKPSQDFLLEVANGDDKCGLITQVTNKRAVFLHHTFAEYFSALWLAKNFRTNPNMLMVLMKPKYAIVRDIFDRIFCKDNELHTAVLNNDLDKIRDLLGKSAARDYCSCGRTVLHLIASRGAGHVLSTRYVIVREEGDLFKPMLELVLANGFWNNKKDRVMHWTPLEYAEKKYAVGVLDVLFKFGVITECNLFRVWKIEVILRVCAMYDYTHLAKAAVAFFKINADVIKVLKFKENFHSPRSNFILHIAASNNSIEMVKFFLKFVDVNIRNHLQQTPLHLACKNGYLETVRILVANNANPFGEDDYGRIPLDIALAWNHRNVEEYLTSYDILKMGFDDDVNSPITSKQDRVLHLAAKGKNVKAIERLLQEGALVNVTNNWHVTPLYVACEAGSLEVAKLLAKNNADLYIEDRLGYIPLDKAVQAKHAQLMQYLSSFEMLKIWFGNVIDKPLPTFCRTALHLAAAAGNVDSVRRLMLGGANLKATTTKWIKWTPLHFAVHEGHLQVVKALVTFGADTDARAHWGGGMYLTPLGFARLKKSEDDSIFKFLFFVTRDKEPSDMQYCKRESTGNGVLVEDICTCVDKLSVEVDEMLRCHSF